MLKPEILRKIITDIGTPVFVYDEDILIQNIQRIFDAADKFDLRKRIKLYISYFTNSNPHLFKITSGLGTGILLQTEEEYHQLKKFGLDKNLIISPSFLSNEEIDLWTERGIKINLASFEEVRYFVKKFGNPLSFRVDLTFFSKKRTGVKKYQLQELKQFLSKNNVIPDSFHIYVGTRSPLKKIKRNLDKVLKVHKKYFPETKDINLGGGFKFDYEKIETKEKHFDWESYFFHMRKKITQLGIPDDVNFSLEPGRDIFADAGKFVISIKRVVSLKNFKNLGTDGSYVYMPSAMLKNRQHNLSFFTKDIHELKPSNTEAVLSGCTTLSRDYVLPKKVKIPSELNDGDIIVINDVGAYCATEHLEFLNKKPCPEVLINKDNQIYLLTERGREDDKVRYLLPEPRRL